MRYREIIHTKLESPKQKERRLMIMYGSGATDGEWDDEEFEALRVQNELARSKALQANADTLGKMTKAWADYDQLDLDQDFPFPSPGMRSMTDAEKMAMWVRASILAGRPLPYFHDVKSDLAAQESSHQVPVQSIERSSDYRQPDKSA